MIDLLERSRKGRTIHVGMPNRGLARVPLVLAVAGLLVIGLAVVIAQRARNANVQVRPRQATAGQPATILVKRGGDLQAAIDQAQYGDSIVLEAGATYESPRGIPFTLPDKGPITRGDASYITIRTAKLEELPPEGTRVSPANAPAMATIVANAAPTAVQVRQNAHHYKFIGIEFTNKDATGIHAYALISNQQELPQGTHPHHIIVDRCFLHPIEETMDPASTARSVSRGFWIDGAEISLINSYVSGFAGTFRYGQGLIDSEAILVITGPGPYHFVNNFLEAWYANIFLGGGGRPPIAANTGVVAAGATLTSATLSATNNLAVGDMISFPQPAGERANGQVMSKNGNAITFSSLHKFDGRCTCRVPASAPAAGAVATWNGQQISDVEIRRNTFNKRPEWLLPGRSEPKGYFEFKNGNNITLDGNLFQGYPSAMGITSRNDGGSNPWSTVNNFVMTNNKIIGYREGLVYLGKDSYSLSQQSVGLVIANNLFLPSPIQTSNEHHSKLVQLDSGYDVKIYNNTVIGNRTHMISGQSQTTGLVLRDNIIFNGEYGFSCFAEPSTVTTCWPGLVMTGNVIVDNRSKNQGDPGGYPAGNFYPDSLAAVGFADYRNGNCELSKDSRYKGRAANQKDPGVDFTVLLRALPSDAQATTKPIP
jgi:Right handed beta helix region